VIVSNPVDVVEDHPHRPAAPHLTLAAHLAYRLLQPLLEKAALHMLA
jgi:hypothetical protein